MKTYFNKSMALAVVLGLLASSMAMADFRDYNQKAWNAGWKGSSHTATARSNCPSPMRSAPGLVRTEPAPVSVAQAPTKERAFSYEPAKDKTAAPAADSKSKAATAPAPKTAEKSTTTRSYSYEPGTATYAAPAVRRSYDNYRSGGSSNSGNSYDRAMRAKGYR